MNKVASLFILFAAIAVSAELSYFPGRSANLVFEPSQVLTNLQKLLKYQ